MAGFEHLSSGWMAASVLSSLLLAGCGSKPEGATQAAGGQSTMQTRAPASNSPSKLAEVNSSLQSGNYDQAAARLLEIRATGQELTPKEAGDYRTALEEAYTKALEAAQKGDPRAQATLHMIKAATARETVSR